MQVPLFKALKSVKVDDVHATSVVEEMEKFMAKTVEDAVKPLQASIDGLAKQISFASVLLVIVGLLVPIAIAVGPIIAKSVN